MELISAYLTARLLSYHMKFGRAVLKDGSIKRMVWKEDRVMAYDDSRSLKFEGGKEISPDMIVKYLVPVIPTKVLLPAVNFRSHSQEVEFQYPPYPYMFSKTMNTLIGHEDPIVIPRTVMKPDYEGEIGAIIGRRGKYISETEALDFIIGYTPVNDVSYRDFQFPPLDRYGLNWVMGKCGDTGMPVGPLVVGRDEIGDQMRLATKVNGEMKQRGSTGEMVYSFAKMISYLSSVMTLEPGDIITSGTPSGVGSSSGRYLKAGDVVEVTMETDSGKPLTSLRNPVVKEE